MGRSPLFGVDCRTPNEAALLPPDQLEPTTVETDREQTLLNHTKMLQRHQQRAKTRYDEQAVDRQYRFGDRVMVRFHREKLSQPWHELYRVVAKSDPDLTVTKVYRQQHGQIQIHQERVTPRPDGIVSGYYWYSRQCHSQGQVP